MSDHEQAIEAAARAIVSDWDGLSDGERAEWRLEIKAGVAAYLAARGPEASLEPAEAEAILAAFSGARYWTVGIQGERTWLEGAPFESDEGPSPRVKVVELYPLLHALTTARVKRRGSSTPEQPTCDACGRWEGYVWLASPDLWKAVIGTEDGRLCPSCFKSKAIEHGISTHIVMVGESEYHEWLQNPVAEQVSTPEKPRNREDVAPAAASSHPIKRTF